MSNVLIPLIRTFYPTLIAQQIVGVQAMTGVLHNDYLFDIKFEYHVHPRYKFSRKWYIGEAKSIMDKTVVVEWCETNFGPHPKNPDAWCRWYRYSTSKFYFRDEKDYTLFLLRWS